MRAVAPARDRLLTADQVDGPGAVPLADAERTACRDVLGWARAYLCRPHQELGRKGAVCPFVAGSLARRSFYLHVESGPPAAAAIEALARELGLAFPGLAPAEGAAAGNGAEAQYKAVLMLFPGLDDAALHVLDEVQARLKPEFVTRGYMIGQFHRRPPANPGLWNAAFRPLTSDVPMLVIRHMVPSDLPFLLDEPAFAAAWFHRFGAGATARQKEALRGAVDPAVYAGFSAAWASG